MNNTNTGSLPQFEKGRRMYCGAKAEGDIPYEFRRASDLPVNNSNGK